MLNHRKEKANPKRLVNKTKHFFQGQKQVLVFSFLICIFHFCRYEKLVTGAKKYDVEGLNSLEYKVHTVEKKILYTWVLVEIKQETVSKTKKNVLTTAIAANKTTIEFWFTNYRAADESFRFHFYLISACRGRHYTKLKMKSPEFVMAECKLLHCSSTSSLMLTIELWKKRKKILTKNCGLTVCVCLCVLRVCAHKHCDQRNQKN